jgi:hypothetical protein
MEKGSPNRKHPVEDFRAMFEAFGKAMSEVFNDPELKEKAKELGNSIAKSAETFGNRFQDEDVKKKFREAGKAAQEFGKSIANYFKANKSTSNSSSKRR